MLHPVSCFAPELEWIIKNMSYFYQKRWNNFPFLFWFLCCTFLVFFVICVQNSLVTAWTEELNIWSSSVSPAGICSPLTYFLNKQLQKRSSSSQADPSHNLFFFFFFLPVEFPVYLLPETWRLFQHTEGSLDILLVRRFWFVLAIKMKRSSCRYATRLPLEGVSRSPSTISGGSLLGLGNVSGRNWSLFLFRAEKVHWKFPSSFEKWKQKSYIFAWIIWYWPSGLELVVISFRGNKATSERSKPVFDQHNGFEHLRHRCAAVGSVHVYGAAEALLQHHRLQNRTSLRLTAGWGQSVSRKLQVRN